MYPYMDLNTGWIIKCRSFKLGINGTNFQVSTSEKINVVLGFGYTESSPE